MESDDDKRQQKKRTNEKPVSLYPLDFDDAIGALLEVKPPKENNKKQDRKGKPKAHK